MDDVYPTWDAAWPGVLPIGDHLRRSAARAWVRVRALAPGSTEGLVRDAEGDDRSEMLRRHRAVIGDLFAPDPRVVVFAEDWPPPDRAGGWTASVLPEARPWRRVSTRGGDESAALFVAMVGIAKMERLLEPVLDGRALFVAADPGMQRLYAPYDLGADVFFAQDADRQAFCERHTAWLSDRPDGL